jgi:hypothetical protein
MQLKIMLFDTSIKNKEVTKEINNLVGKPYSLLDILKIGAIGSSRMEIIEFSKLFTKVMAWDKQAVFANIGMRPKGIVVVINVRLSNYSWVIPYNYLSIFKTDILTVHGQGEYLKFKIQSDQNKKLIQKILDEKVKHSNHDYHGDDFY